jgi:hypothetical protein
MGKIFLLATLVLLPTVLLTSRVDTASAELRKNQILLPATCDNDQEYSFVINGMSKVGQIVDSNNNIVIKRFTVEYFEPLPSGAFISASTFDQGNKMGLQGDLIKCTGSTTTDLQGLGSVTAVYEFEGVVLPRGASSNS